MSRALTTHHVNDCNKAIEVLARGEEKNAGGIPIYYDVFGPRKMCSGVGMVPSFGLNMRFQNGPPADGINGLTNEVLLAILHDRLACAQAGKFACAENGEALEHIVMAQAVLKSRTERRQASGIEGTHAQDPQSTP